MQFLRNMILRHYNNLHRSTHPFNWSKAVYSPRLCRYKARNISGLNRDSLPNSTERASLSPFLAVAGRSSFAFAATSDLTISVSSGLAMRTGFPNTRRVSGAVASKPRATKKARGAAADNGTGVAEAATAGVSHEAEVSVTVGAEAGASDDGGSERPTKRVRKELPAKAGKAEIPADAAMEATGTQGPEPSAKSPPGRARKARSKKATGTVVVEDGEAAAKGDAGGDGKVEDTALLGAREAKPEVKAKSKKGQKAEPLPQYTAALRKPPPPEGAPVLKILSWNVAGLRALLKKHPDAISSLVEREGVEVVCLQEHKLQDGHTAEVAAALNLKGWFHHWACSTGKLGYSGVSVHTRTKPLSVTVGLGACAGSLEPDPEHELEGRVVTVELQDAFVVSVYVPNSGEGLKRLDYRIKQWDGAFAKYIQWLEARGKPVIVTGDLNCAHHEIDIHAPKTNLRSAGFTVEERESFDRLLLGEVGLVDTFRALFPGTVAYTYFTRRFNCREQNKGWRLDYFLTSGVLMPATTTTTTAVTPAVKQTAADKAIGDANADTGTKAEEAEATLSTPWRVYDSWILQDVYGSDHLPLGLTLIQTGEH